MPTQLTIDRDRHNTATYLPPFSDGGTDFVLAANAEITFVMPDGYTRALIEYSSQSVADPLQVYVSLSTITINNTATPSSSTARLNPATMYTESENETIYFKSVYSCRVQMTLYRKAD